MGEKEKALEKKRLLNMKPNERLFRINAGMGWVGEIVKRDSSHMIIKNPRPLRAGPDGWLDLTGWETVEITPDMVGKKIAVFKFVELKPPYKNGQRQKLHGRQIDFKELVEQMGGIVEVVEE